MASPHEQPSDPSADTHQSAPRTAAAEPNQVSSGAATHQAAPPDGHTTLTTISPGSPPAAAGIRPPSHRLRRWLILGAVVVGVGVVAYFLVPWVITALNTVSTDDAYVNGHFTMVAPRVAGQVSEVLVDDNYRVKKGDVLVRLDKEPYQVQVEIKTAAVAVARTKLAAAEAQVRSQIGLIRANRFKLAHAIEDVDNQIANLRAAVAKYDSQKATLALAKSNLKRGQELAPSGGISKEELDQRQQIVKVDEAGADQALQNVYSIRAGLGLPEKPPAGDLSEVTPNLDQNFSTVREALGTLMQSAAQIGYFPTSWNSTPKQAVADFYKQDQAHNLDRIYAKLIPKAPAIKEAEADLLQAQKDLAQADLNLRYCDVVSEIDGVVTGRNVNPGDNVQVGQSLMAVRSLTEIWIDANFKETQLANLRIGQRVRCEVDMYGRHKEFEGRITGFTMGTGQTLALLPPQNATGNFVKIVQRLPVRIELTDYSPDKTPLFVGLSVTPYVYYKEPPKGPHAGDVLQPLYPLPQRPTEPKP